MGQRIVVTSNHVPFLWGGAEFLSRNLVDSLRAHGHDVEWVRFPFKFSPAEFLHGQMVYMPTQHFEQFNGISIDQVISLQYPGYGVQHPNHVVWLIHQHRSAYDLHNPSTASPEDTALAQAIHSYDTHHLGRAQARYTISQNVANRLQHYNGLHATALYHPPPGEALYHCQPALNYVFFPSRIESLKRQHLAVEAMLHTPSNIHLVLAGTGGQQQALQQLIQSLGLTERVLFLGHISEAQKAAYYARSLGVLFCPQDEDLGYVTLEAMLSAKPVITCSDSGGPLEFIIPGETGLVCEPHPQAIGQAIAQLATNPDQAAAMGQAARQHYSGLNISWANAVQVLTGGHLAGSNPNAPSCPL